LEVGATQVRCVQCGAVWPVEKGIPRFFDPHYYWGEHTRERASEFLSAAEHEGWNEAVKVRFAGDRNMLLSILDWQRTAWLPLLGLDSDAVALDVGCGHGAITESLPRTVGWVYALEAIPERIEFTRVRLQQGAISNVSLLQASALDPPCPDNFFDLIVVNGVLEWVGEWDLAGNPRSVQLRFLRKLHRLLKDDGILLIGIENRFGYGAFLGAEDHSGVAYTSLMPRFMASLYLRVNRRPHHRTALNPRRQYRTYTYGERGYRRLLAQSGFGQTRFYWADPGYNEPYHLVPLKHAHLLEHLRAMRMDPSQVLRTGWRVRAKTLFAWALRFVAPDFVIFAQKGPGPTALKDDPLARRLRSDLPHMELKDPLSMLSTYQFSGKSVVRVVESGEVRPQLILKVSTPADGSKEAIQSEFRNLTLVAERLRAERNPGFAVPAPLRAFQMGNSYYAAQSPVGGEQLHRLVLKRPRPDRFTCLRTELNRCIGVALQIARIFTEERAIAPFDDSWWKLPSELASEPDLQRAVKEAQSEARSQDRVQHGDFTVENILIEAESGILTIIDWENLMRGAPVLYDVFSLLLSVVPLVGIGEKLSGSRRRGLEDQFLSAFFRTGSWARLYGELLLTACKLLSVGPCRLWDAFVTFLVLRSNYFALRGSAAAAQTHVKFLVCTLQHREEFLIEIQSAVDIK